jgi:transposase
MWSLPKGEDFLPDVSLRELQRAFEGEKVTKSKMRLLCAIHRKKAESLDEITAQTGLKRRTVHEILHRFCERGLAGKDSIKQEGRPSSLSVGQRRKILKKLEAGPPHNKTGLWTTKEVRELIRKDCDVEYTHTHTWTLLKAAGFSIQRPRPRHYKADEAEAKRFKKRLLCWEKDIGKRVT